MTEIHVEAKKKTTPFWIWILIALIVLGVIAYVIMHNNRQNTTVSKPAATSFVATTTAKILLS